MSLREALHVHAVVQEALHSFTGQVVPGPQLCSHVCHNCQFVGALDRVFVCLHSGNQHICTEEDCKLLRQDEDGLVCPVSGYAYTLLVAGDHAKYSKQQRIHKRRVLKDDEDDIAKAVEEAMAAAPLEDLKDNPFDSQKERAFLKSQREHSARILQCERILETLLFSPEREELNRRVTRHTQEKHNKNVSNYLRSKDVAVPAFVHILQIVASDRRDVRWCHALPQRDDAGHRACRRVCEDACVWWNRFMAHPDTRPPSSYSFQGHVLAVLYIYAEGMANADGKVLLPASTELQIALPGDEKLQSAFSAFSKCHYTYHERHCRSLILKYLQRQPPS